MKVKKYLAKVARMAPSSIPDDDGTVYVSGFDGSYLARVGMESDVKFLAEQEITEELTNGVGFSPKDNKWYGWSHRAIYGFEIGSTCKKGDCHYFAGDVEGEIEAAVLFWSDEDKREVTARKIKEGVILVEWTYTDDTPNESMRGKISSVEWNYNTDFGRGEWVAATMADAKQMATDFNKGVS